MYKWLFILSILFYTACKEHPKPVADSRINDYALYDAQGGFHRFSYYNNSKAIVLFVQGNGCPMVRNALTDFKEIVDTYTPKGFTFFMLNANPQDSREEILKESTDYQFPVPVLDDSAQLLADMLDIKVTTEAIVLHPTTREILYRGPLNNRLEYETQREEATVHSLQKALDAIANGHTPHSDQNAVKGCKVTRLKFQSPVDTITYTKDIAPMLKDHCVMCHREGGIGPWQMTDYETIKGWSAMIKQVLLTKRMPPWKADPHIGDFQNDFSLADSSTRKLVSWIDDGMMYGNGPDPLQNFQFPEKEWTLGTPDTIIKLKKEQIPENGVIPYRYQRIALAMSSDKWIKGIQIKPGNPKVMHHILVTNQTQKGQSPIVNRPTYKWIDDFIALGGGQDRGFYFPEESGVLLPKDSELIAQIHYTPTGKPETDETLIGLYFHDSIPKKEFKSLATANNTFTIPPFGKDIHVVGKDTLTKTIKLHYMVPHMHYRGKSIQISYTPPNGKEETIVSVADYNFNWQRLYMLKEPMTIPKGSIITVEGVFDNTFQNPFNPDPSKELHYGFQSFDEMLIGFFNYTLE